VEYLIRSLACNNWGVSIKTTEAGAGPVGAVPDVRVTPGLGAEQLELGARQDRFKIKLTMYVVTEVVVALLWWHTWLYVIATDDC